MSTIPTTGTGLDDDLVHERKVVMRELPPPPAVEPEPESPLPAPAPEPAPQPVADTPSAPIPLATERLVSLDAYRGLVMVLMISAGLQIGKVVQTFDQTPELAGRKTALWQFLAFQTDHVRWVGCSLWDLIQPSFMFMVGAAAPFSLASRRSRGQPFWWMLLHAIIRSVLLVLLGVFLVSHGARTNWTFDVVLTQIGLGYTFLFLLAWCKPKWQLAAAFGVLLLYWAAFAVYPKPPADLDPTRVGLPEDWQRLGGFASHWDRNTNLGAAFDRWFINLFPQANGKPFEYNYGGYVTLNFIPSLATMIFGLLAGELVRSRRLTAGAKFGIMIGAGALGLALGWVLGWSSICPVVKRIWTPSWAIYSAGWAFLMLSLFYVVIDVAKLKAWSLPLVVVGMNSIAAYCMSMMLKPWVRETMQRHFGPRIYRFPFGQVYAPMVEAGFFLLFCWAVCWWLYRKKFFIKI